MLILGIESSCDETAASVVENGKLIISNVVSTQEKIHSPYGGVVPEIASRNHLLAIIPVIDKAVKAVGGMDNIDIIAVTNGPGLVGSLLVGVQAAKTLSYVYKKKLVAVNHLEAHLRAPFCNWKETPPPEPDDAYLALLVSGGHTILFHVKAGIRTIIGATRDDAAGEAFDKVAKMLGLGYPGGKVVDNLSKKGDDTAYKIPVGLYKKGGLDYSFSGMKTAVRQLISKVDIKNPQVINDICASFQKSAVDALLGKVEVALSEYEAKSIVISGGVAANSLLRERALELADKYNLSFVVPPVSLCTDNAAMVASSGYIEALKDNFSGLELNAFASSLWSRRGELVKSKGK